MVVLFDCIKLLSDFHVFALLTEAGWSDSLDLRRVFLPTKCILIGRTVLPAYASNTIIGYRQSLKAFIVSSFRQDLCVSTCWIASQLNMQHCYIWNWQLIWVSTVSPASASDCNDGRCWSTADCIEKKIKRLLEKDDRKNETVFFQQESVLHVFRLL